MNDMYHNGGPDDRHYLSKGLIGNLNSSIAAHRAAIGLDKLFKEAYLNIAQMFKVSVCERVIIFYDSCTSGSSVTLEI